MLANWTQRNTTYSGLQQYGIGQNRESGPENERHRERAIERVRPIVTFALGKASGLRRGVQISPMLPIFASVSVSLTPLPSPHSLSPAIAPSLRPSLRPSLPPSVPRSLPPIQRHTLPTCRERVSSWSRVTPRSRTVVENRTPGKRSSKMERSTLDNCTRPPTQMNCVFPGFNLRRFEDNQAPITSETRSIFSTRQIASEVTP